MKSQNLRESAIAVAMLVFLAMPTHSSANDQIANPSSVGMSNSRLQIIDQILQDAVDSGNIPMGSALVARNGKIVYHKAFGFANVENQQPLQENSIYRIASMSKFITSLAAMICYEQGKFTMDDPVSLYIPAFANSTVAEFNQNGFTTRAPIRPITIRDILTHKAGMLYQPFVPSPLLEYYQQNDLNLVFPFTLEETLESYVNRLGAAPKLVDPGVMITYGVATDVLGRLVEVWSGQSLDQFIQEKILTPLEMEDTQFFLAPGSPKAARVTAIYQAVPQGSYLGTFEPRTEADAGAHTGGPQMLFSGGSGLLSTSKDYFHLAQMVLNRGTYEGKRVISAKALEMMSSDQLGQVGFPEVQKQLGDTTGFGLGIRTERGTYDGLESLGTLSFGGSYWTRFWIDHKEKLVVIAMTQCFNLTWNGFSDKVKNAAYQAIENTND